MPNFSLRRVARDEFFVLRNRLRIRALGELLIRHPQQIIARLAKEEPRNAAAHQQQQDDRPAADEHQRGVEFVAVQFLRAIPALDLGIAIGGRSIVVLRKRRNRSCRQAYFGAGQIFAEALGVQEHRWAGSELHRQLELFG